ncbi:MAG: chemotaxis response regulator protein-glutamate methylesterase [Gammaproteobacteria bacterium]|nr:chemotaxis response regulator protein-glutamate methylesterase [Gammaproteobacteria bacterium]MDH5777384.1 chemotaxis response regulator protein-glutamate methylesterase [Gammaproteobacteria bacterium]
MSIKVLVVDDSGFFRRRVGEMINADPQLEVIGYAHDGKEAIELNRQLKPDVITMDIEMPVMNGIESTRRIMADSPTSIIMFSSLTTEGASATFEALEAGALDFLPKRFQDIAKNIDEARTSLCQSIKAVGRKKPAKIITTEKAPEKITPQAKSTPTSPPVNTPSSTAPLQQAVSPVSAAKTGRYKVLAIGTSTGGPLALQNVLTKLPADFPLPIIIVQHMPGSFTPTFAQRLDQQCAISVKEAASGDLLKPGLALLAPGGMQMRLNGSEAESSVIIEEGDASLTYKPSVDITFDSIAKIYPNNTLAVIMTGMGADGREGSRALKQNGSTLIAQDEASCVVYGMPAAVVEAGLADEVLNLDDIGPCIASKV